MQLACVPEDGLKLGIFALLYSGESLSAMATTNTSAPKQLKHPNAKSDNPWDSLPILPVGDSEPTAIYQAVGLVLTCWETLEGFLGSIFSEMLGAHGEGAAEAYGQVVSFNGRYEMLLAAYSCYAHRRKAEVIEFPKFLVRVKNFSGRRNEIAHGVTSLRSVHLRPCGFYLGPPAYNARKRLSLAKRIDMTALGPDKDDPLAALELVPEKYAYTSEQIIKYGSAFCLLATEALNFEAAMRTLRPPTILESLQQQA